MKILYFAMDNTDYNDKSHELLVAEELVRLGNELTLVSERVPFGYDKFIPEGIKFRVLPINKPLSEEQYAELASEKYDVAFCSSFPAAQTINRIAKEQGIKSVVQILDIPVFRLAFSPWDQIWTQNIEILKDTDIIIGNIEVTRELLCKLSNDELKDKIKTIYYGIATENADKVEQPQKENYIVWVSGIRWYKGLEILILALKCMKNPPTLVVVGSGDQTELEINRIPFRVIQLASHLGVRVDFRTGIGDEEKFRIIKGAKLGVMIDVSRTIATMFVQEAIYCGVPCITANLPVCKDRYGDTAIYVDDIYNTRAWADKIQEVLDNIEEHTKKAQQDKGWILENRSFISQAKKLNEVFHNAAR